MNTYAPQFFHNSHQNLKPQTSPYIYPYQNQIHGLVQNPMRSMPQSGGKNFKRVDEITSNQNQRTNYYTLSPPAPKNILKSANNAPTLTSSVLVIQQQQQYPVPEELKGNPEDSFDVKFWKCLRRSEFIINQHFPSFEKIYSKTGRISVFDGGLK